MALEECVASFLVGKPDVGDIFYATTPPAPLVRALEKGMLHLGNLALSVSPNVFISPETILDRRVASGTMDSHQAFAVIHKKLGHTVHRCPTDATGTLARNGSPWHTAVEFRNDVTSNKSGPRCG